MSSQNNDIPEGFEVGELGPLPIGWEVVKLGKIASARGGIGFPPEYQGQSRGKYPFYKVSDMNLTGNERFMRKSNNFVDENIVGLLKAKPFPPDTVIFPKVGAAIHTNKKRLLTSDALVDNNVMGIMISDRSRCVPEYLLFWFDSIDIGEFSNPGPLPSINAHSVKDRAIPLPPLPEQKAIARVLSTIQGSVEAQDKIIAAARELKKSLMHHLFAYGPVAVSEAERVPLRDSEIGPVPEHWDLVKLGDILKLSSGKSRPPVVEPYAKGACIHPLYGGNGVMGYTSESFVEKPTLVLGRVGEYCGSVHISSPKSLLHKPLLTDDLGW